MTLIPRHERPLPWRLPFVNLCRLAVVACAFVLAARPALACSCVDRIGDKNTPEEELASHDLVVVAEVLSVRTIVDNGGCQGSDEGQIVAKMRVLETFDGARVGDEIRVSTDTHSCGDDFKVGEEWLLFTQAARPRVGYCDPGSTPLGDDWTFSHCVPTDMDDDYSDPCGKGYETISLTQEEVLTRLRASMP